MHELTTFYKQRFQRKMGISAHLRKLHDDKHVAIRQHLQRSLNVSHHSNIKAALYKDAADAVSRSTSGMLCATRGIFQSK